MIGAFVVALATSLAGVSGFLSERLSQILELAQGSHVVSLLQGVSNSIGGGYESYALMLVSVLLAIVLLIRSIELWLFPAPTREELDAAMNLIKRLTSLNLQLARIIGGEAVSLEESREEIQRKASPSKVVI